MNRAAAVNDAVRPLHPRLDPGAAFFVSYPNGITLE